MMAGSMRDIIAGQMQEQPAPPASASDASAQRDAHPILHTITGGKSGDEVKSDYYNNMVQPYVSFAREAVVTPMAFAEKYTPGGMIERYINKHNPLRPALAKMIGANPDDLVTPSASLYHAMLPKTSTPASKLGAIGGMVADPVAGSAKGLTRLLEAAPVIGKAVKAAPKLVKGAGEAAVGGAVQSGPDATPGDVGTNAALAAATHGLLRAGAPALAKAITSKTAQLPKVTQALAKTFKDQPGETAAAVRAMRGAETKGVKAPMYAAYAPESAQKLMRQAMAKVGGTTTREAARARIDGASREAERFVDDTLARSHDTGAVLKSKIETARKKMAEQMFPPAYSRPVKATPEVVQQLEKDFAPKSIDLAIRAADSSHERKIIPALREMRSASLKLHAADLAEADGRISKANLLRSQAQQQLKGLPAGAYHMVSKIQSLKLGEDIAVDERTLKSFRDAMQGAAKQDGLMSRAIDKFRIATGKMDALDKGAEWFQNEPGKAERGVATLKAGSDIAAEYKAMEPAQQKLAREAWVKQAVQYFSGASGGTVSDMEAKLQSPHFKAVGETILGKDDFKSMSDFMEAHVRHYDGTQRLSKMTEDLKKTDNKWAEIARHTGMALVSPFAHGYHMVRAVAGAAEKGAEPELARAADKRSLQALMTRGSVADVQKAYGAARKARKLDQRTERQVRDWLSRHAAAIGAASPKSRSEGQ